MESSPESSSESSFESSFKSSSESALCLSKYLSVFVWTYVGLCRDWRRHARLRLNLALFLDLDLDLNLNLYLNLNLFLFQKPFEKPNPSSLRSLSGFRNRSLSVRVGIAPRPKTLLPGRPLYAVFRTCARLQPVDNTYVMSGGFTSQTRRFFSASSIRSVP
jgi:hypothetical protein